MQHNSKRSSFRKFIMYPDGSKIEVFEEDEEEEEPYSKSYEAEHRLTKHDLL